MPVYRGMPTFGVASSPSTAIPNTIFDDLLPTLGLVELKALLYIMRHTLGYAKTTDHISLSQFEHGIVRADGSRVDGGTGCGRKAIMTALKNLETQGVIMVVRSAAHGRNAVSRYQISPATLDRQDSMSHSDSMPVTSIESSETPTHEAQERKKEKRARNLLESNERQPVALAQLDAEPEKPVAKTEQEPVSIPYEARPFADWWREALARAHRPSPTSSSYRPATRRPLQRWHAAGVNGLPMASPAVVQTSCLMPTQNDLCFRVSLL